MKKWIAATLTIVCLMFLLCACAESRIVHCDRCGAEITLDADSNIDEDWIVFCKTCEKEAFGDNPVVSPD